MVDPEFSPELLAKLLSQISQDPGPPRPNPTVAAWHDPPHPLADVQSEALPQTVDFAVLGSGITGCSVAKSLLENRLSGNKTVMVFDARRLTTGATSRNGGFLMGHAATFFASFANAFGVESAVQIARFVGRTLDEIMNVAKEEDLHEECQIRDVQVVITCEGEEDLAKKGESFRMYQEHLPEYRGTYLPVSKEEAEKVYLTRPNHARGPKWK
jgi:glycine/D-amino acid oxidase-like deaminating enzyme